MVALYYKHRAWVFTSFNYTDDDISRLENFNSKYIVIGEEVCPTTNRNHLQGYICLNGPSSFNQMKQLLPEGSHIEIAKQKADVNRAYCVKGGKIILEMGKLPKQGERTDLEFIRKHMTKGGTIEELIQLNASPTQINYAKLVGHYLEPKRNWKPTVIWIYGPTGTGKSTWARKNTNNPYITGDNLKWWDGYDGHEDVIIDEFRADRCSMTYLLRLLDEHPMMVETKGSTRQLRARRIFITCNKHPKDAYNILTWKTDGSHGHEHVLHEDINQLMRRISALVHLREQQSCVNIEPKKFSEENIDKLAKMLIDKEENRKRKEKEDKKTKSTYVNIRNFISSNVESVTSQTLEHILETRNWFLKHNEETSGIPSDIITDLAIATNNGDHKKKKSLMKKAQKFLKGNTCRP